MSALLEMWKRSGGALTPWISSNEINTMECGPFGSAVQYNYYSRLFTEVSTYTEAGKTYSVMDVGIPGVGMIVAVEPSTGLDRVSMNSPDETRLDIGENIHVFMSLAVRFIKIGTTRDGSFSLPSTPMVRMRHEQRWTPGFTHENSLQASSLEVVHIPLCQVQSRTVGMGVATLDKFRERYDHAQTINYDISLLCESNAGRVNYYLEQAGSPVYSRVHGIVEVEGGAAGVGLQFVDAAGNPLEIGKVYPFGSSEADGLRTETFGARYIRTAANLKDVKAGPANAQIRYRIDYP